MPNKQLPEDLFLTYLADKTLIPSLAGKTVAITGTTSGLGHELARLAISKNAALILLLNRTSKRSQSSEDDLRRYLDAGDNTLPKTTIKTIDCDLMSFDSVRKAAAEVNRTVKPYGGLHVLCNNAGIMAFDDKRTADGFDLQMQTNVLSHFLLTSLVYPSVKDAADKRGEARIVTQSSSARDMAAKLEAKYFEKCEEGTLGGNDAWQISQMAFGKGGPWTRYIQTKLANSAFAMELHKRLTLASSNIRSVAFEPGYSVTSLQDTEHMGLMGSLSFMMSKQSAADGCLNAAIACFSPDANSGDLYAPEKGLVGKPIKYVAGGERMMTGRFGIGGTDKGTCDPGNQKLVWDACEKALGIKFEV